ncbi:hypothetical protein DEDE109153_09120 [Deinococcus deserti]|uniref:Lipoprotein n=1 Tax=Deinococcus deserti (strain DSM 17065 / CIP 109153 / LMG 22923 / VCD115) TaxID=546414 RepID=C1D455_DEIDV|nr:hypothetical protein [Deinococcus deserti]ACO47936.1 Hypothetical protein, precursor [Deinococcus deserti VCD115]
MFRPLPLAVLALAGVACAAAPPVKFTLATPPGTKSLVMVTHPALALKYNVTAGPGSTDPKAEFTFEVNPDGCLGYEYFARPGFGSFYGRKDLCGFSPKTFKIKVVNAAPKLGQWTVVAYLTNARGQSVPLQLLASVTPWSSAARPTVKQITPPLRP